MKAQRATGREQVLELRAEVGRVPERRLDGIGRRAAAEATGASGGQIAGEGRLLVVVDEPAALSPVEAADPAGRARRQAALASQARMARLGRALSTQLVLATQRPDAAILLGQIEAKLPATLAFRVRSKVNCPILLRDPATAWPRVSAGAAVDPLGGAEGAGTSAGLVPALRSPGPLERSGSRNTGPRNRVTG